MTATLAELPLRNLTFPPPPQAERSCPASCFLVSAGVQEAGATGRYHWDNRNRGSFCLLQYTVQGEGWFEDLSTGVAHAIPAGHAFLVTAPGQTRYWLPENGNWRLAYALFSGVAAFHHCKSVIAAKGMVFSLTEAEGVLAALRGIVVEGDRGDFFHASQTLYNLLMALRRWAGAGTSGTEDRLAPAFALIERDYADAQLGVDDLAASCGFSRYHFTRLFRACAGVSPQAYLIKTRLKHALRDLSGSDQPPKQIALACGFNDYSYFCQLFRRNYGLTPGSVRRSKRGE